MSLLFVSQSSRLGAYKIKVTQVLYLQARKVLERGRLTSVRDSGLTGPSPACSAELFANSRPPSPVRCLSPQRCWLLVLSVQAAASRAPEQRAKPFRSRAPCAPGWSNLTHMGRGCLFFVNTLVFLLF